MNSPKRTELIFRLNLNRELNRRTAKRFPSAFRRNLKLTASRAPLFGSLVQPWQQADFAALDRAWKELARVRFPGLGKSAETGAVVRRAWVERPRGHSKTSDMAIQIAWILQYAVRPVQGLAAAADLDQAALIRDAVERIARHNPELCGDLEFHRFEVVNRRTRSRLTVISSHVASSWGALPDFVICDELCHWERPGLWHSLSSSAAKQAHCVLAVLTNAGVGRGWQWEARETARRSPQWHFSSLQDVQAPWIAEENLEEQRRQLPPAIFDRLWRNLWQHSDGGFVTPAEVEACRDESLRYRTEGRPGVRYFAGIDYAEKHDNTACVVVHCEGERVIVDRMDVAVPQPDEPVLVSLVESWLQEIAARFHDVTFVLDAWQLLSLIQKFDQRFVMHRFDFAAGKGNHALALTLRRLIVHRQIAWYPGCGRIDCGLTNGTRESAFRNPQSAMQRDDLETELASLLLRQSASGYCRITHHNDGRHHDDRAFALGAACLFALQNQGAEDWMQITPPTREGTFQL